MPVDQQPPTCNVRNWRVFTNGFHKDSYYSPQEVQRIADNFHTLKGVLTPVMGLGHDRKKRLQASLGLPNVGEVSDVTSDGRGNLFLDVTNVPTWLGGMINARRYRAGSIELKPEMRDPRDPGVVIPGPVCDAVAILGDEQPAVKGCEPPVATFDDGTPVPPNHDPMPVPSEVMASLAREDQTFADSLCFSEAVSVNPNLEAILAGFGLTPEQVAQAVAACPAPVVKEEEVVKAAPAPDVGKTDTDQFAVGDGSKKQDAQKGAMEMFDQWDRPSRNHSEQFASMCKKYADDPNATPEQKMMSAAFSNLYAETADLKKRFGAVEAAKQEESKKAEADMAQAFSDQVEADVNGVWDNNRLVSGGLLLTKLGKAERDRVKQALVMQYSPAAKLFAKEADRTAGYRSAISTYAGLPDDPKLATAKIVTAPDGNKPQPSAFIEYLTRPGSPLAHNKPEATAKVRKRYGVAS